MNAVSRYYYCYTVHIRLTTEPLIAANTDPITLTLNGTGTFLNADMLVEIMSHVPDMDAAKFMLVGSRLLYHQAILKTLKRIKLWHSKSIEGFLSVLDSPLSLGKTRYLAVNTIKFRHSLLDVIQPGTQKRLAKAILRLKTFEKSPSRPSRTCYMISQCCPRLFANWCLFDLFLRKLPAHTFYMGSRTSNLPWRTSR